jgi:hypothetical protein
MLPFDRLFLSKRAIRVILSPGGLVNVDGAGGGRTHGVRGRAMLI